MKIKDIISRVDEIKPNAFDENRKVEWMNELEGRIILECMMLPHQAVSELTGNPDRECLVGVPHDAMYRHWLEAQIDYANGEYDLYNNTMSAFNAAWNEFSAWFGNTYHPADGYRERY